MMEGNTKIVRCGLNFTQILEQDPDAGGSIDTNLGVKGDK